MGLYDTLELPADISLPGLDRDPSTIGWQTKSIGMPALRTFRITPEGRLLQEEFQTEEVPDEERHYYGTDKWDDPLFQMAGSFRHVHDGWSERQYHGVIRFVAFVDNDLLEYEAKFTDGRLVALREFRDDDGGGWNPIETLSEAAETVGNPDDTKAYKRTATRPLADAARMYDISLPDELLTETRHEERYLQISHLPDDRGRHDAGSRDPIPRRRIYELVIREPITIEERDGTPQSISKVVERDGPYELDTALHRAVELSESQGIPIHHEIVTLRPDHWSDASSWVTCPDCGSDEIMLVTNLDEPDLTLACQACDARVTEADRESMFHDWLHCPSCTSGDVNVELSAPHGGGWWSCDDCGYDTLPAPIDTAYMDAREEGPLGP